MGAMFFRRMRRRVADDLAARLGGAGSIIANDDRALAFGVESGGAWQVRGNGCLAATRDELAFLMWIPRRELRIPRERITGIERTRSHLGKTIGRELLRVRFTNDADQPDSAAWFVRDLPSWEAVLTT